MGVKRFPNDESLHCTHVKRLERVIDTETVLPGVKSDLVEVLLNETLLLHELDVGERVGSELNSLDE